MPSEYFYPHHAQGAYLDPHKPSTNWYTAQQGQCVTVAHGGSGPKKQDLIRNVKPALAAWADPAKIKIKLIDRPSDVNTHEGKI